MAFHTPMARVRSLRKTQKQVGGVGERGGGVVKHGVERAGRTRRTEQSAVRGISAPPAFLPWICLTHHFASRQNGRIEGRKLKHRQNFHCLLS